MRSYPQYMKCLCLCFVLPAERFERFRFVYLKSNFAYVVFDLQNGDSLLSDIYRSCGTNLIGKNIIKRTLSDFHGFWAAINSNEETKWQSQAFCHKYGKQLPIEWAIWEKSRIYSFNVVAILPWKVLHVF